MISRFIFIFFILPIACNAENINCKYPSSFVDEQTAKNENIKSIKWEKHLDDDSGEHVKKLSIIFNNKDTAIIEHKYCDMYNFEYTFTTKQQALNKKDIAEQVVYAFKYSKIQPKFKTKLNTIILNALDSQGFDAKNSLSIGLPSDQILYNDNVEYGIEYSPANSNGTAPTLVFYLSIGGI